MCDVEWGGARDEHVAATGRFPPELTPYYCTVLLYCTFVQLSLSTWSFLLFLSFESDTIRTLVGIVSFSLFELRYKWCLFSISVPDTKLVSEAK